MSSIARLFWGMLVFAAGVAAILHGLDRLPASVEADGPSAAEIADGAAPAAREVGNPANADLRTNPVGIAIIKKSEGLRLEAYQGGGGQWLIGYGHARTAQPGMIISEAEAEALLGEDVAVAENSVKRLVRIPVNVNEFSAMVSLRYNLPPKNFERSPVVREINLGNRQAAADAFRTHVRAGGKIDERLKARREQERALFLTPIQP
jgi:lysozyme